jgi:hypothetical protein
MPDEPKDITVDADKFDRILAKMLNAKPLSKAEISERVKTEREAKKAKAFEKYKKLRASKKLGQQP